MQPSQLEIQREVEALRDIRRRSTTQGGPGALIDPDLPNPSSPTSPTANYWSSAAASASQQLNDGDSSSGSHEDSSSSEERAISSDDPFHLFWVPARLHPEIAPAEFRAFLKEHARTPPPEGPTPLGRSATTVSPALERKRSMLSRQYKPPETDDVEEDTIVPIRRHRTVLVHAGPQLTINDLQRLEELAEEASKDGDPAKFRTALRRSLSLNVSPSAIDAMGDIPPMPDEADAPIIVPPPGQILRRAARTKIRKASASMDGDRGFSARRRRPATKVTVTEPRTSSDLSSNDHTSEQSDIPEQINRPRTFSNESLTSDEYPLQRSDPYGEETSIYDAYAREDPDTDTMRSLQSLLTHQPPALSLTLAPNDSLASSADAEPSSVHPPPDPELQHPQPQRINIAASIEEIPRTPSPDFTLVSSTEETVVATTSSDIPIATEKLTSPPPKKEKDKRGLFGKWGNNDKSSKKLAKAEREREKDAQRAEKEKEKEKEKESGFFGSFFSGKKRQDDSPSQAGGYAGSGRDTAAALLGNSKSKGLPSSPSPQPGLQGPYARYPIHVERAIYRLSHIKLANPRRPLYEQVLISNLMFWYLGVINKTQNPNPTPAAPAQGPAGAAPAQQASEHEETERREVEEQQRAENERLEREKQEREREQSEKEREREKESQQQQQQQQKEKSRRGTLTKPNPTQQGSRRTGEMLVKGPQYEMQHRVMEQEYHGPGHNYGVSLLSAGASAAPRIHRQSSPPNSQSQPIVEPESMYMYPGGSDSQILPAGKSATPNSSSATAVAPRSRPSSTSPTNGPVQADTSPQTFPSQRSRSPPAQSPSRYSPSSSAPGRSQPGRGPARSLSATVSSGTPPPADGKARKVLSAHAVAPSPNGKPRASIGSVPVSRGEEEDMPLAVYQQQRRR